MKSSTLILCFAPALLAQPELPLRCDAIATSTPSLRAEGQTELLGDVLYYCSGGSPTLDSERTVPSINLQIFASPVFSITSRRLSDPFTEALLLVDDPPPQKQTLCGSPAYPYQAQRPGDAIIAGVCSLRGAPAGQSPYDPDTPTPAGTYRGNVYQARRASRNSLIWQGVPFDPPGTLRTRSLRITNVRVNASQAAVRTTPQSVSLIISTSVPGSGILGLPIINPRVIAGVIQPSVQVSTIDDKICHRCESANLGFVNDPGSPLGTTNPCDGIATRIRIDELFPTAFKRRNADLPSENSPFEAPVPLTSQDTPGTQSSTESGFYKARAPTERWPAIAQNGSPILGPTPGALGLADTGTRIVVRIDGIPDGAQVWLARSSDLIASPRFGDPSSRTGLLAMAATHLQAGVAMPDGSGVQLVRLAVRDHQAEAVYEILSADTTAFETAEIPVVLAWQGTSANTRPALGRIDIRAGFGPISIVEEASGVDPIPRFVSALAGHGSIRIDDCRTHLLFPFVTGQKGFDTSLVILNTSKSPFNEEHNGACTIYYEGVIGTTQLSITQPLRTIPAGEHVSWTLLGGGAADPMPGFQGYVIADCAFRYAHGYAFVGALATLRSVSAYPALVMDDPVTRTGDSAESSNH